MRNDLQVNQPALIINVEKEKNLYLIGKSVMVVKLLTIEESKLHFRKDDTKEPYAIIDVGGLGRGILQRYLMPIPPLDDQSEIESKLILTPWELAS